MRRKGSTLSRGSYKPAPTRALNGGGDGIELLGKVLDGAEITFDSFFQGPVLENTAVTLDMLAVRGRCEILPEEGMVDVTTTVEAKSRLEGDALFRGRCPGVVVFCSVEGIDVCLVMLVMVQLHDLCDDVWLECIVAVRQVGEGVCARHDDGHGEKQYNA